MTIAQERKALNEMTDREAAAYFNILTMSVAPFIITDAPEKNKRHLSLMTAILDERGMKH